MPPSIPASVTTDDSAAPEGPSLVARLLAHRGVTIGLVLFGIVVLAALTADWISPHDPLRNNFRYRLGAPNDIHWLGTDRFGRDILSRVIHGTRVSLRIGLMVVLATGVLGALIGAAAGYFRRLDRTRRKIAKGLVYPIVLIHLAIPVSTLAVTAFGSISFDADAPAPDYGGALARSGWAMLAIWGGLLLCLAGAWLLNRLGRTSPGVDSGLRRVPLLGTARHAAAMERFTQVFEIFLRNKRAEWNEYRLQVTPHELKRNIGIL